MQFIEITSLKDFKNLVDEYNRGSYDYIALDSETTGLDRFTDKLLSFTLTAKGSNTAYYIDISFVEGLKDLKKPLVLHNFKFDFHMFAAIGIDLRSTGLYADTIILDHLLNENNTHSLDDIVQRRYNDPYKAEFWGKYESYSLAPKEDQISYSCKDVLYTDAVCRDTLNDLSKAGIPLSLVEHVQKLALTLYDTELNGVKVDLPRVSIVGESLSSRISTLHKNMRDLVELDCQIVENSLYEIELDKRKTDKGKRNVSRPIFNFDSSSQLCRLLYGNLSLPPQFSKKRNLSVDDESLVNLEHLHPVIPLVREYRGLQKVYSSFIISTLDKVRDGVIYPSFNPCGARTGRISASDPNLQQLPAGGGIRGIYVPKERRKFISADYKQLEVILAAHFSRDPALLSIVYEGKSQHDITARGLGIPRQTAKSINFALQYGAGPSKIKTILGCSDREAELAYNRYWDTYPGLRDFVKRCHDLIDRGKPLVNPFGRRRHFPTQFSNKWEKERAQRQAPNALIQGTGADCTNYSFYTVDAELRKLSIGKALLSVHDEIIIEVEENSVDVGKKVLQTVMEGVGKVINLSVPLGVDVSDGMDRWED